MNGENISQDLLVQAAARLYTLGVDLEGAKAELRRLTGEGVSFSSGEMRRACEACEEMETQWKALEQEYLALRRERAQRQNDMEQLLDEMREA